MKAALPIKISINYRSYLRDLLIEKKKKNALFSLRSFARLIGIQPSYLSMVLSGKRDLSEDTAHQISEKLLLSDQESKKFITLLRLEKAGSIKHREQILSELKLANPKMTMNRDLSVDQFRIISEWYHLPLQILAQLEDQKWSEESAGKKLGISTNEVLQALERLVSLELIEWKRGVRPKILGGRTSVASPFKNEALQKYHTQMLEKNIAALIEQKPDVRFTGTMNLALDEKQLKEAHAIMDEAMEKLRIVAEPRKKGKKIFHANLNIFQITKN